MRGAFIAAAVILPALALVPSEAQVDLAKLLIGRWEGEFSKVVGGRIDTRRTITIGQVRQQDGKWIVGDAKYGVTGERLAPVDVALEVTGDQVKIEFVTPVGGKVKLELSKERNMLIGRYIRTVGFRTMELKRVE